MVGTGHSSPYRFMSVMVHHEFNVTQAQQGFNLLEKKVFAIKLLFKGS